MRDFLLNRLRAKKRDIPKVFWCVFAKNAENDLPLYLRCLLDQEYPKERMYLYFRTNDNNDRTLDLINEFKDKYQDLFIGIHLESKDIDARIKNTGNHDWTSERVKIMADLRQESILQFLNSNLDFYFTSDVDNFLLPDTLVSLIKLELPIVAPMLRRPWRDGELVPLYSNYHLKISNEMFYEHHPHSNIILERSVRGLFQVPLVHCTYLVQRSAMTKLSYLDSTTDWEYKTFAKSAMKSEIPMYLDNRKVYGVISLGETTDVVTDTLNRFKRQRGLDTIGFQVMHIPTDVETTSRRRVVQKEIIEKLSPFIDFIPLLSSKLDSPQNLFSLSADEPSMIYPDIRTEGQYLLPRVNLATNGRPWLLGEIGQWGTWLRALEDFSQSSKKYLLLFADDMWLAENFANHVSEVISEITSDNVLVSLYSFEGSIMHEDAEQLLIPRDKVLNVSKFATSVLLWSKEAAERVLQYSRDNLIDQSIEEFLKTNDLFDLFIVNPSKQNCSVYTRISNLYSTIHTKDAKPYRVDSNGTLVPDLPLEIARELRLDDWQFDKYSTFYTDFKSQNFQDLFALHYAKFKESGYFVEFGACDGVLLSNTYVLEKRFGWTGLLAEPASVWHESLSKNRNCSVYHDAISDVTGEVLELLVTDGSPEVSALSKFNHDFMQEYRQKNSQTQLVKTLSINDLLHKSGAPNYIDFFSIDTEGNEYFVLNALDFDKYSFGFLSVEHNNSPLKKDIMELMNSKGYVQVHEEVSKVDSWFVPKSLT